MNPRKVLAILAIATVIVASVLGVFHLNPNLNPNSGSMVSRKLVPGTSMTHTLRLAIVSDVGPAVELPVPVTNKRNLAGSEQPSLIGQVAKIKKPARPKPPIQDPDARAALSFVGADPDAEAYWIKAINDPSLPAEERKDLIEDLNEDGLSNPHHPSPEDMPLIASRIQLIEQLAAEETDPVNTKAFGEAYKDLVNLYNGQPAQ